MEHGCFYYVKVTQTLTSVKTQKGGLYVLLTTFHSIKTYRNLKDLPG